MGSDARSRAEAQLSQAEAFLDGTQGFTVPTLRWRLASLIDALRTLLAETAEEAVGCRVCKRPLDQHRHGSPCSCQFCCNRAIPAATCNCAQGRAPHDPGCDMVLPWHERAAPPPPADAATKDDIRAVIGEGFHTMLRKGIDGHGSGELHRYICEMEDGGWVGMLDYWVVDPLMEVLAAVRRVPADAATEAVPLAAYRTMTPEEDAAQRRSFAYGNAKLANDDVTREMVSAPAPAPSADRCAAGHDWIRRGEGSCGDRYVCLRCGERKP